MLAVCRGAQLLAIAHGGRLSQRVPAVTGHPELAGLGRTRSWPRATR